VTVSTAPGPLGLGIPQLTKRDHSVKGAKPRAALVSGGLTTAADELRQRWDERLAGNAQAAAQIIPESHAMLHAGFGQAEEGIPAIASAIAAGTDLATDHLTTDVIFGAVGVKR
jgi:hypothetical protein